MGRVRKMIGLMSLVWVLAICAGAVAFMLGVMHLSFRIIQWSGSEVAMALSLPVSLMLGMVGWMFVLAAIWRLRRNYLRRVGIAGSAVVVKSDLKYKGNQGVFDIGLWHVRVEARFPHPDSNEDALTQKQYSYPSYRESKARSLAERLSVGSSVPVIVRKNSALFDIPERPLWADIF